MDFDNVKPASHWCQPTTLYQPYLPVLMENHKRLGFPADRNHCWWLPTQSQLQGMVKDKYNFDENLALLGYGGKEVGKLRERLVDTLGVSCETAKTRAHNILELAAELRIIREHPDFVEQFNDAIADQETRVEIKKIL